MHEVRWISLKFCKANTEPGEDLQNKTVLKGCRFTAVFIGLGGINDCLKANTEDETHRDNEYIRKLNVFLTDTYASLILVEQENEVLKSAAHQVGLYLEEKPDAVVLTDAIMARYMPLICEIGDITYTYIISKLESLQMLLSRTILAGRAYLQGI